MAKAKNKRMIFYNLEHDFIFETAAYPGYQIINLIVRHEYNFNEKIMFLGEL